MALKFSSPKPSGSMREWQAAQVAFLRCASNCWRIDIDEPILASSRLGTSGGGGGGGAFRTFSRIHLPRSTGEVRVAYDDTVRTLACVKTPPRCALPASETLRNSGPVTFGIL